MQDSTLKDGSFAKTYGSFRCSSSRATSCSTDFGGARDVGLLRVRVPWHCPHLPYLYTTRRRLQRAALHLPYAVNSNRVRTVLEARKGGVLVVLARVVGVAPWCSGVGRDYAGWWVCVAVVDTTTLTGCWYVARVEPQLGCLQVHTNKPCHHAMTGYVSCLELSCYDVVM